MKIFGLIDGLLIIGIIYMIAAWQIGIYPYEEKWTGKIVDQVTYAQENTLTIVGYSNEESCVAYTGNFWLQFDQAKFSWPSSRYSRLRRMMPLGSSGMSLAP